MDQQGQRARAVVLKEWIFFLRCELAFLIYF
jgi:hypothetical protein